MWNRREFLAGGALATRGAAATAERPNLLVLLTDDQRWDALGCMGSPWIHTPEIDALARGGVTFDNNFCATAICMTSRASIFTGLLARAHRINRFEDPLTPADDARSYPRLLRAAGYRTGFIGKFGVGDRKPQTGAEWDFYRGFPGQGRYFPKNDGKTHLTRLMADDALEFLDGSRAGQPFCLSISFKAPHAQDEDPRQFLSDPAHDHLYRGREIPLARTAAPRYFDALPPFLRDSEGRVRWAKRFDTPEKTQAMLGGYYRLISGVDEAVGRIRRRLAERGLAENTVILFTSDNGMLLAEHGLTDKWFPYEESIRTPLIIHDPRAAAARRGRRVREMALNIDVAPTLVELAGLSIPAGTMGRSLRPLLDGRRTPWRREWFYEHHFPSPRVKIPRSEAIRTERWMYVRYIDESPVYEQLFDLRADPLQERDLARDARHGGQLSALRERWQSWTAALGRWERDRPWEDPQGVWR